MSEELSYSELEALSGALDSVAWTADAAMRITFVGTNATEVFGYPRAAWLETPDFFAARLHPDEREVTLALCRAVGADGRQRQCLHRFVAADGRARWVRTAITARTDHDAITRLVGLTAVVPEVVELHEREQEAQRLILEQLPAIVWTTDRELRFTSGTGGGLTAIGLRPNQLIGGTVYEYFRVDDPAHPYVASHLRALAGDNATFDADWIGRSYEIHVEPFHDRQGAIVGVIGVAHDVTARKRAEAERNAQRQLLAALISNMVEGVLVADVAGQLTLVNAAARRMFALANEPVATSIRDIVDRARARTADGRVISYAEMPMTRALAGEVVNPEEIVVELGERALHFVTSAAPIREAEGARPMGAVAVIRDESERAEFEQVKDQFLRVAAHELKTPITILKAHAQAMRDRIESSDPVVRRMLDAMNRGADRLTRVIEDLLDVSQLQLGTLAVRMEALDLGAVVAATTARFAAGAHRDVRVVAAEPVSVRADRARLEQCVRILLDNAIRYSPEDSAVEVAVTAEAGRGVVAVSDHGVGIPPDKQARLFQRFQRAHTDTAHDYGGLGVGLYILREIITRHDGEVSFVSVPGRGSTFRFSLPAPG